MNGTDTGSEIVHTGWRNSSVNKGRNERMLKGHIYQMKEVFVFVFVFWVFIKAKGNVCPVMLHSLTLGEGGEGLRKVWFYSKRKSQMFTPKSSISLGKEGCESSDSDLLSLAQTFQKLSFGKK